LKISKNFKISKIFKKFSKKFFFQKISKILKIFKKKYQQEPTNSSPTLNPFPYPFQ